MRQRKIEKAPAVKQKKSSAGYRLAMVFFVIIFLIGAGILFYPTISNQWNTYRQHQLISDYTETVEAEDSLDLDQMWKEARVYNAKHGPSNIYADLISEPFSEDVESPSSDDTEHQNTEYWNILNPSGDGVMGYISIPKINIKIPIYHGTSDEDLKQGAGHLSGSQLPIGGEGNHAVIAAHRGLPSAKLFSDLDELEIGDSFYLYILDEVLAYEVDQILPMIEKNDEATLSDASSSVEGEDLVTLYTCTPYGVNTHRLLVRGYRVPYEGENDDTPTNTILQAVRDYYMLFLLFGIAATALGILIVRTIVNRKIGKKRKE